MKRLSKNISYHQSLEDILNAVDSDDEGGTTIDITSVDLEALLRDDDNEDDDYIISNLNSNDGNLELEYGLNLYDGEDLLLGDKAEDSIVDTLAANANEDNELLKTIYDFEADEVKDGFGDSLVGLNMAENREKRFLQAGIRGVVSALQAKRSRIDSTKDDDYQQSINADSTTDMSDANTNNNNPLANKQSTNLKCVELSTLSTQLKRNASYRQHGPGIATVVHAHEKLLAIGTSRGLILLFDHSQEIRQVIGSSVNSTMRCSSAVTAIDFNATSNMLICGHDTGEIAVWDIVKGTSLKRITDLHQHCIVRLKLVFNIAENVGMLGSEFHAITVDIKGSVHRVKFSKLLWSSLASDSECLLDGSAGAVFDMATLPPLPPSKYSNSSFQKVSDLHANFQFVAFNSMTRSYVVLTQPFIKILFRWPAPPSAKDPETGGMKPEILSSLDWSWCLTQRTATYGESDESTQMSKVKSYQPILARVWHDCVQILAISMNSLGPGSKIEPSSFSFTILRERRFVNQSFIWLKWLKAGSTLALMSCYEVHILSTNLKRVEMTVLLQSISTNIRAILDSRMSFSEAIKSILFSFNEKIYVLFNDMLYYFHIQSWSERADALIREGNWLEALASALDFCHQIFSKVKGKSHEKKWNKPPPGDAAVDLIEDESEDDNFLMTNLALVDRYIEKYVELAIAQPVFHHSKTNKDHPALIQSRNHYHLVAGVCIEYCIHAQRLDLLFQKLYRGFESVKQDSVFLDALEPFILSRALTSLPQYILDALIELNRKTLKNSSFERCICFLDLAGNNVDELIKLMMEKRMFSGLIYVRAYREYDFFEAFKLLFDLYLSPALDVNVDQVELIGEDGNNLTMSFPSPEQANIGYKLLLFIRYTAEGNVFPRGDLQASNDDNDVKREVKAVPLAYMMENIMSHKFSAVTSEDSNQPIAVQYPYLSRLHKIDAGGLVYCISVGLNSLHQCLKEDSDSFSLTQFSNLAEMAAVFFNFVKSMDDVAKSDVNVNLFFRTCEDFLLESSLMLSPSIVSGFISFAAKFVQPRKDAEEMMCAFAFKQSKFSSIVSEMRDCLGLNCFWRAILCLPIRRAQTEKSNDERTDSSSNKTDLEKGIQGYLQLHFYAKENRTDSASIGNDLVFDYVDAYFRNEGADDVNINSDCVMILCRYISDMATVNMTKTTALVCSYLPSHCNDVISATKKYPSIQFTLLSALMSSVRSDPSKDFTEVFTPSNVLTYIKLLINFRPDDVYSFLLSTDHYPLDESLALCRENGNAVLDATAYLLEKAGDANGAQELLHYDLTRRFNLAKKEVELQLRADLLNSRAPNKNSKSVATQIVEKSSVSINTNPNPTDANMKDLVSKLTFYKHLNHIVDCLAGLCSRHCTKANCAMWFDSFDRLLLERQSLRSGLASAASDVMVIVYSLLLQLFMAAMKNAVPPESIVRRVAVQGIGQVSGSRFSEFKDIIMSMVETYENEIFVYELAAKIHVHDLFLNHKKKFDLKRRGERHSASSSFSRFNSDADEVDIEEGFSKTRDSESEDLPVRVRTYAATSIAKRTRPKVNRVDKLRETLKYAGETLETRSAKGASKGLGLTLAPPMHFSVQLEDLPQRRPGNLPRSASYVAEFTGEIYSANNEDDYD